MRSLNLCLLTTAALLAQQAQDSATVFRAGTRLVVCHATVVDASPPDDEVFIVNFNDTAYLDNPQGKDFTSDIGELEEALKRIDARGGTAMRDAIQMSIEHLRKGHRDKKVLVVITDGNDNSSLVSLEQIM